MQIAGQRREPGNEPFLAGKKVALQFDEKLPLTKEFPVMTGLLPGYFPLTLA